MTGVREDLVEVLSRVGGIMSEADRLGITPRECAERIVGDLRAYKPDTSHKEERAYLIVKHAVSLARALT